MQLFNAHKNSDGFTLIEIVVILFIVGILSAIAAPSFLGLLNRGKVNNAVAQVQGALQEAQREAIRKSRNCTVILTVGSSATLKSPPEDINNNGLLDAGEDINKNLILDKNSCLVTGNRTLPNGVAMATNIETPDVAGNPIPIEFTIQGNTKFKSSGGTGNIILYQSNGPTSGRKCVAISKGIGILRSGTYPDSDPIAPTTSITAKCNQIN